MSDVAKSARYGARFGARFISVLVITETEIKHATNRARFATSDISLNLSNRLTLAELTSDKDVIVV